MMALRIITRTLIILLVLYLLLVLLYYAFFDDHRYVNSVDHALAEEGSFTDLSTGKIFHRQTGRGSKVVILLHGYSGSSISFKPIMEELGKQYQVIALDFPGSGLSSKQKEDDLSFAGKVKTVEEFMTTRAISQAYLIGHSVGVAVAAQVALNNPDKIEKLVLLAPAGYGNYDRSLTHVKYIPPPLDRLFMRVGVLNNNSAKILLGKGFFDDDLVTKSIIANYLEPTKTKRADWGLIKQLRLGLVPDLANDYAKIIQPTLILWGEQDEMIPSMYLEEMVKSMDDVVGYLIHDAGHSLHEENTESIAERIKSFLAKII